MDTLDLVIEFGGGYGSMSRLFRNLGFKGKYIIFDLPLFSALQAYYLQSIGLQVNSDIQREMNVVCISEVDQVKSFLENHGNRNSLFLATWSLSEVPVSIREPFLEMAKKFNYLLFSFQKQFGEVNNLDYFKQYRQSTDNNVKWTFDAYSHIPGNYYLVGQTV